MIVFAIKILLMLSIGVNILLSMQVAATYTYYNSKMVWNIDKIRNDYMRDAKLYYTRGCRKGAQIPEEEKRTESGWNLNGPATYCARAKKDFQRIFEKRLYRLGR